MLKCTIYVYGNMPIFITMYKYMLSNKVSYVVVTVFSCFGTVCATFSTGKVLTLNMLTHMLLP